MFDPFYNLKENPFPETPDTRFNFVSQSHGEVLKSLTLAHAQGRGFTVVTGEVGTGKTHLSRVLLKSLPQETSTALILYSGLEGRDLMVTIAEEFGITIPKTATLKVILEKLTDLILKNAAEGRRSLLWVDEAQNLSLAALETIRVLSNIEQESFKLLHIVLAGQPEFLEKIATTEARQLNQRITHRLQLGVLTPAEVEQYIRHRIEIAGGNHYVQIKPETADAIYQLSAGIPRLVNVQCRQLLEYGSLKQIRVLDTEHLIEALQKSSLIKPVRFKPWRRDFVLVQR